jgi:hypothetical protein
VVLVEEEQGNQVQEAVRQEPLIKVMPVEILRPVALGVEVARAQWAMLGLQVQVVLVEKGFSLILLVLLLNEVAAVAVVVIILRVVLVVRVVAVLEQNMLLVGLRLCLEQL